MRKMTLIWNRGKKVFLVDVIFCSAVLLLVLFGLFLTFFLTLMGTIVHGSIHAHVIPSGGMPVSYLLALPSLPNPFGGLTDSFGHAASTSIANSYGGVIGWLDRQGSLLVFTDPAATYANPVVYQFWRVGLYLADSAFGILIVLAGYHIILGGYSSRYASAIEELPKLIFGVVGANISLIYARLWIDLNNFVCTLLISQVGQEQPLSVFGDINLLVSLDVLGDLLAAVLAVLIVLLGIQMAVRLATIIFLTIWLPVLFVLLTHASVRRYGQAGLTAYPVVVATQALQLSALIVGTKMLIPFLVGNIGKDAAIAPVATIVAGIALVWMTLRIPAMLRSWALQPLTESSSAARSFVIASVARLMI